MKRFCTYCGEQRSSAHFRKSKCHPERPGNWAGSLLHSRSYVRHGDGLSESPMRKHLRRDNKLRARAKI